MTNSHSAFFVLMVFLVGVLSASGAQAQFANSFWSFEDQPHPAFGELSDAEYHQLTHDLDGLERVEYCRTRLANGFDIYVGRYPDFIKTGELDKRYRDWKHYIAVNDIFGLGNCHHSLPFLEIIELRPEIANHELNFCGATPPSPATDLEAHFQKLTGELMQNASDGQLGAYISLLNTHDVQTVVFLNPDIEYFLRRVLAEAGELKAKDWDVSHLLPKLNTKRIAALDDAVARKDFTAIVETTGPCAER